MKKWILLLSLGLYSLNHCNLNPGGGDNIGDVTCLAICSDSFGIYEIYDNTSTYLGSIGGTSPINFNGSFEIRNAADNSLIDSQSFTAGNTVFYNSYAQYSSYAGSTLDIILTITSSSYTPYTNNYTLNMTVSTLCGSSCGVSNDTFNVTLTP